MPVDRPFRRTCRQLVDGSYLHNGNGRYVCHSRYAVAGRQYVRAFMLLQKDVLELFDYVEPADINLPCYSYRIHELHMRTCIEVEAHCKAILSENSYRGNSNDWTMNDYRKLDRTHHLSSYEVRMPLWHGARHTRPPFAAWAANGALPWYQAYNAAKHDRHNQFASANFDSLVEALGSSRIALRSIYHSRFPAGRSWPRVWRSRGWV